VRPSAVLVAVATVIAAEASTSTSAEAAEPVRVLVPDAHNLQYLSFWLAKAAGYFADEGVLVELVTPPGPQQTEAFFESRQAEVAVLPPPVYLRLIADHVPVVLVANLLANDPIDLVVRRSILEERKLRADMPLRERLEGLHGLRMGVAPHPPTRLRALFASEGLDADRETRFVILPGKMQNAAFRAGEVDALYAHTPYLEAAIVQDDAVVLVNQSRGEVQTLANRQIHTLAVRRSLLDQRMELVERLVRAIGRAERLVHTSQPDTVAALAREMPTRDHRELETLVRLYEPAIPQTPAVRAEDIPAALDLFPDGMPKPDLAGIDLEKHVAPKLSTTPPPATARAWTIVLVVTLLVGIGALFATRSRTRA
jgi:ABC-type nitrate/sulfonate/bicarbonate transport system substrate-binding protein